MNQNIEVPFIATLIETCPYCGMKLDGDVFVSFKDQVLGVVTQTKTVGNHDYTWVHTLKGCFVPSLRRLPPQL